jgi:hypothetical protein
MIRAERESLLQICRMRLRLAKDQISARSTELKAQFEAHLPLLRTGVFCQRCCPVCGDF